MNLIQRAQDLLLKPKDTWPIIAAEPASVASIYKNWVLLLAAIPVLASFIGLSVIGVGALGFSYRVPLFTGLLQAGIGYGLSLAMVYLVALLVDALAPTFGGTRNFLAALKLVAYGCTAAFLGGIFSLMPSLSILGLLAALYSIYLFYTGLPVLMRNPAEKSVAYTVVVAVAGLVAGLVLAAITNSLLPSSSWGSRTGFTLKTPDGEVSVDTRKLEEMAQKMEEAGKQMEAAGKAGDSEAAAKAFGAMMGAAGAGKAVDPALLRALLPERLDGLPRVEVEAQSAAPVGLGVASAAAVYRAEERKISLRITDTGGMAGMAAMAAWAQMTVDRETETEIEKVFKRGKHTVRERIRKDGSSIEMNLLLANGVVVEAQGEQVDAAQVRKALERLDLGQLETLQRPAQ